MKDRSDLSALYSKAKTIEQRAADHGIRERLKQQRTSRTRATSIKTIILCSATFLALLLTAGWLSTVISPVAMGMLAFPVGLIMVGLVIWFIKALKAALSGQNSL